MVCIGLWIFVQCEYMLVRVWNIFWHMLQGTVFCSVWPYVMCSLCIALLFVVCPQPCMFHWKIIPLCFCKWFCKLPSYSKVFPHWLQMNRPSKCTLLRVSNDFLEWKVLWQVSQLYIIPSCWAIWLVKSDSFK